MGTPFQRTPRTLKLTMKGLLYQFDHRGSHVPRYDVLHSKTSTQTPNAVLEQITRDGLAWDCAHSSRVHHLRPRLDLRRPPMDLVRWPLHRHDHRLRCTACHVHSRAALCPLHDKGTPHFPCTIPSPQIAHPTIFFYEWSLHHFVCRSLLHSPVFPIRPRRFRTSSSSLPTAFYHGHNHLHHVEWRSVTRLRILHALVCL